MSKRDNGYAGVITATVSNQDLNGAVSGFAGIQTANANFEFGVTQSAPDVRAVFSVPVTF